MSKALLSSFRTAVLLTLFFDLVGFLVFLSWALRRCRSPANIFSTLTKNGRRLAELLFFSVLIADSIRLKQSESAFYSGSTDIDSLSGIDSSYFKSVLPLPVNSPPPIFIKKNSSPRTRCHLKIFIPPLSRGRGGVCANYGFIYRINPLLRVGGGGLQTMDLY